MWVGVWGGAVFVGVGGWVGGGWICAWVYVGGWVSVFVCLWLGGLWVGWFVRGWVCVCVCVSECIHTSV